jgi:3-keto-disaccharide hydrolase
MKQQQASPAARVLIAAGALLTIGVVTSAAPPGDTSRGDTPRALPSQKPPRNAIVLFDGKDLSRWRKRDSREPAPWRIENGAMVVGGGDIVTRDTFRDFRLHVEFSVPSMPRARGQGRGNSGVYLHGRYEVQVLDSYGPAIEPPGRPLGQDECGAIYSIAAPRVNATLPPGVWQTYDIDFTGPRLSADGSVAQPPRISVVQNGVRIHDNVAVTGPTTAGMGAPSALEGPVLLQDHGNPVRYRNIWLVPKR